MYLNHIAKGVSSHNLVILLAQSLEYQTFTKISVFKLIVFSEISQHAHHTG